MFDTQDTTNSSREFLNMRAASNAELSYLNIPSTLEIKPVTVETTYDTSTSLSSTLSHTSKSIKFITKLFSHQPEWFGIEGEALLYLQHAGKRYKPEAYYNTFSTFLLNHNAARIKDIRNNTLKNEICYDIDLLISWARVIQTNKLITEFEPIMKQLKVALNDWFANKSVDFGGKKVPYANFKSLLYTHSGESIYSLLPFVAYVYCFFINCYPFTFDEGQTDSSSFGLFSRIEAHFDKYLTLLANDMSLTLDELTNLPMEKLTTNGLTVSDWMGVLKEMLAPDVIIKFRNDEMNKTPELLEQAISQQNSLDTNGVKAAFADVLSNLIYIVVNNSPVKRILDMLPQFDVDKYSPRTVSLMTEWALAGADKLFNIELSSKDKADAIYTFNITPADEQPRYPQTILSQNKITTNIAKINQSHMHPFANSDFILRLVSSHVKNKFDVKRQDAFDDEIELNQDAYEYEGFANDVKNVFVNAVWALEGHVMAKMLDKLILNTEFVKQMSDIVVLDRVCEEFYDNKFAAKLIVPFILCQMKQALKNILVKGWHMKAITPYTWLGDIDKDGVFEHNLVRELACVAMGILYIKNDRYSRFVNNTVDSFMNVLVSNPLIYDVYVKCLDDDSELYAAGGCSLYDVGVLKNPLLRGLSFVKNMIGWSANMETVYRYVETMVNSASFEVIEENKKSLSVVEALLKTHWIGLFGKGKIPYTLNNYVVGMKSVSDDLMAGTKETLDWVSMNLKSTPYFIDLKVKIGGAEVSVVDLALRLAFKWSNPKAVEEKTVCFRPVSYRQNVVNAGKVMYNKMVHGGREYSVQFSSTGSVEKLPVYDYTANVEDVGLIFVNPSGMRRVVVEMFSSVSDCEQCVWVYTTVGNESRFRRTEKLESSVRTDGDDEDVVKSLSLAQPRLSKKAMGSSV